MATAIFMPKQGMSMEEGVLVNWLVKEGDKVEINEPIMEIETDKITMESEAPASGIVLSLLTNPGETVPVLDTMGWIGELGEEIPLEANNKTHAISVSESENDSKISADNKISMTVEEISNYKTDESDKYIPATPFAKYLSNSHNLNLKDVYEEFNKIPLYSKDILNYKHNYKVQITPVAKRLAQSHNIDINDIKDYEDKKIRKSDILNYISRNSKIENANTNIMGKTIPVSNMRKVIGRRMLSSSQEIPSVTQVTIVDVTKMLELRKLLNTEFENEIHFTINDFVLKAVINASLNFPQSRTRIEKKNSNDEFYISNDVNLGVAVGTNNGLLVPVIHSAQKLSIKELSLTTKSLIKGINDNTLKPDKYIGQTITVSNLGSYGIDEFTPIINQPDSMIVGVGAIKSVLFLNSDGEVNERKELKICLTYDHRILDGLDAAKFSLLLKELLEKPIKLLLD